jgi:hypothetical protein
MGQIRFTGLGRPSLFFPVWNTVMKLLRVTVVNIDGQIPKYFTWLFDQNVPVDLGPDYDIKNIKEALAEGRARIRRQCVEKALSDLVAPQEMILQRPKNEDLSSLSAYGILLMPGEELEYVQGDENAYWVFTSEYELGTVIKGRGI